jgi:hypothetical protein
MPLIWQDIDVETYIPWINNLGNEIPWINNNGEVVLWRGVTAWLTINTQSFVPSGPSNF